jgi:CHAT domain-containing protein/tetratricopeptide (TPR) repeat protein
MNFTVKIIAVSSSCLVFYSQIQVSWSKAIRETDQMVESSPDNPSFDDAYRLSEEGLKQYSHGFLKEALRFYEEELIIRKKLKDLSGESMTLNNIALIHRDLGEKQKAIEYYGQALILSRATSNRTSEAYILNGIGALYDDLGQKEKALDYYNQCLPIMKAENDIRGEAKILNNIAAVYNSIGKKQTALEYYEQALPLRREAHDFYGEASTLRGMGLVYSDLGEKQKGLEYHSQSLSISRSIKDRAGEAAALSNIAGIYADLKEYQNAIEYFGKALLLMRAIPDPRGEAYVLSGIGVIYRDLGEKQKALDYYQQSLPLLKAVMDPVGEAAAINNIASILDELGDKLKALDYYNQALALMKSTSDRSGEAIAFANIGLALSRDSHPELAITFYKQSVDIIESLRADIKGLPKSTQQKYVQSVSGAYRALVDLLLKENRVLEAEQVLDLLKVQELDDYFRNVRGNSITKRGVVVLRPEQEIIDRYNFHLQNAVKLGQELSQLQNLSNKGVPLTVNQKKRKAKLDSLLTDIKSQFNDFIHSSEVQKLTDQLTHTYQQQISLDVFDKLRTNLREMRSKSVLLYPLILDDRIELILTTSDAPPLRRVVKVKRIELNQAIIDYRDALENPNLDAKPLAQKLYTWLIAPLESDLQAASAKTILYAPDGPLRYVPLSALHDGKQWLTQKYAVNNITAVSLSELSARPQPSLKVLAGAFANKKLSYQIQIGQQPPFSLHGLPFAGQEINTVAAAIPETNKLVDQAFSLKATKPLFSNYNILHFATHALFFPGTPEDSFLLFGDGERASLRSIDDWSLNNVDLVVLSGCETGVGVDASPRNPKMDNATLGSGVEVLGLGYQFQKSGARAVIASLWAVDDGGTESLMSAFYTILGKGNISKAEALRQAQVMLIEGKVTSQAGIKNLTHPHYWAPFFLIGNGL